MGVRKSCEKIEIPSCIQNLLSGQEYNLDRIGMSDSSVLLFPDKVLKIQRTSQESDNEYRMMQWLQGKLPVPQILEYERDEENSFLLMGRCPGEMSCSEENLRNPDKLVSMLAVALTQLWAVDISDCPSDCTLQHKLEMARYQVENGLVDLDNVEPDTFGEGGFESPSHLLDWLYGHRPAEGTALRSHSEALRSHSEAGHSHSEAGHSHSEAGHSHSELVLSHGDFCLPNIFFDQGKVSGYIDLGRAGIADKWQDIALCYRSLAHNFSGAYYSRFSIDYDVEKLFELLEVEPDEEKLRYYILLDELF